LLNRIVINAKLDKTLRKVNIKYPTINDYVWSISYHPKQKWMIL